MKEAEFHFCSSVVCNDQQGDLFFYSAGPHRNQCWPQLTQEKLRRDFGKEKNRRDFGKEKNASGWTRRVEIHQEEIPSSRHSMHCFVLTYSRLLRENL